MRRAVVGHARLRPVLFQRGLIQQKFRSKTSPGLRPVLFQRGLILHRRGAYRCILFETRAISEGSHSAAARESRFRGFETRAISEGSHSAGGFFCRNKPFETRAISEGLIRRRFRRGFVIRLRPVLFQRGLILSEQTQEVKEGLRPVLFQRGLIHRSTIANQCICYQTGHKYIL